MIRHIFLDKTNTIVQGGKGNMGLNPIMTISYGKNISRGILHFDEKVIKEIVSEVTDKDKITYTLKMTNCFSVDDAFDVNNLYNGKLTDLSRASSFDLILFELPYEFDEGRGYDYESDFYNVNGLSYNENGSNWYKATNLLAWPENGVYSEIPEDKIIGTQHFDFGDENLSIDITSYVNKFADKVRDCNYGLGLAFVKDLEETTCENIQSVTFFTDHTNTFYHPYVEINTNDYINDDRTSFVAGGKENRLYLYANINGEPQNLDKMPVCKINDKEYEVKKAQKGVYFALISASTEEIGENTIQYDIWSNLALNGEIIDDVEMEFVSLPKSEIFKVGGESAFSDRFVPCISGINDGEKLNRNEIREVCVDFRKKYTTDKKELIDSAEYCIYIKEGNTKTEVIPFNSIEKAYLNNFFMLYTEDFIPGHYYIDIKVHNGRETRYYENVSNFEICGNKKED